MEFDAISFAGTLKLTIWRLHFQSSVPAKHLALDFITPEPRGIGVSPMVSVLRHIFGARKLGRAHGDRNANSVGSHAGHKIRYGAMAATACALCNLMPLAFLPSGGQWVIIAMIGVLLFAKRLPQAARYVCEVFGDGDSPAAIRQFGVFLAFCLFAFGCWTGIVELASGHSASSQTSFMAAAFALGLALMLARGSGPD